MRRSLLFLPGNSPSLLMNGVILPCDSIIMDLEDAVAPDQKDAARLLVRGALATLNYGRRERIVRINSLDSAYYMDDLRAIVPQRPDLLMPPKVEGAAEIQKLDQILGELERENGLEAESIGILPLIETAAGVEEAYNTARASKRVKALFLGAEDLSADLRCQRTRKGDEIFYARTRLVNAARACGIEAIDTPFIDVNDDQGIIGDTVFAKSLGFSGKAAISPRHLATINRIFSPTQAELIWAQEVVDILEWGRTQGKGAVSLRGKMVDKPIVLRAEQILAAGRAIAEEGEA